MPRPSQRLTAMLAAAALVLPTAVLAADKEPPPRVANGLAQTPPMGWNSWNKFACNIDEATVRRVADAMAGNGMKDAGYQYVVIDDCWHGPRDAGGFITYDAKRFPNGIKALADYVHAKGLKFGIYSDAGRKTCGGRPGSQGHEYQDAKTYASWGVDYLKYDWCETGTRNAEEAYTLMADALRETGRDIVFSMCEWGTAKPWLWAANVGNLWRTTGDITDKWDGKHDYSLGVMRIVDLNEPLYPFAGPGHWNDPDMLEVGNGGLTTTEYRSHFSLWALMAAPLIAGNDVANMDQDTRDILLNKEVIAVNQDRLGAQGRRVRDDGDLEVWSKPLADGSRAVILFNRGPEAKSIAVDWTELGYPATLKARVRDLWAHKDLGKQAGRFVATAPSHGVVMVRVTP
ncbi:glycoside hydrolase family 27 protein [Caulobacter sp. RL271]|uniref:Alpha-galactosidase n=1 Tax=Caulobacter segnis TaxID=88688 RepID=A0ABY4ZN74_9CAUL|nr:glycoside hydrolase family 27 protein [Caulobacter segnis]USQ94156.1 glycoside hydrolase family 27 protein [Caulobacter segnis]